VNSQDVKPEPTAHQHVAETVHVVVQRGGIPYEIEQQVCTACNEIIGETPVKRASA
jgi:hypothetical protein